MPLLAVELIVGLNNTQGQDLPIGLGVLDTRCGKGPHQPLFPPVRNLHQVGVEDGQAIQDDQAQIL